MGVVDIFVFTSYEAMQRIKLYIVFFRTSAHIYESLEIASYTQVRLIGKIVQSSGIG